MLGIGLVLDAAVRHFSDAIWPGRKNNRRERHFRKIILNYPTHVRAGVRKTVERLLVPQIDLTGAP
jgi:hypothetical protein